MRKYQNDTDVRRSVAQTEMYPQAYEAYVQRMTGHDTRTTEALLRTHGRLAHGGSLTSDDVALLQRAFPAVPAQSIARLCADLGKCHPGQRADLYLAMLAGDRAAVEGRFNEAGDAYKSLNSLAREFERYDMADALERRRDGGTVKPEPAQRPTDPSSVRAIVEREMYPGRAELMDAIERGVPEVEGGVRELMAQRLERAADTLWSNEGRESASLRDTLDAAWTSEAIEAEAVDQGYIPPTERD